MAANVESMFYTREKPWHGLGTRVEEAPSSSEALQLAGLDWTVTQEPIYTETKEVISGYRANVRSSDRKVLGVVTDRYKIVQNHEAFAFTDALLGEGVRYETAGALQEGKRVWLLARLPREYIISGERISPYLVFSNTHDGSGAVKVALTPVRVVCNNTLNLALDTAKRSWSMVHTGNIKDKIQEAENTLFMAEEYMDSLGKEFECLRRQKITDQQVKEYIEQLLPIEKDAIFAMIDKKVMAEYGVYEANYNAIEKENMKMTFPTTKNVNVFRFIKEIKGIVTLPIQEFERSSNIKGFISKQWADMLKNYLSSLRNEKENRKIESSVNEMKALIQKMDIMLDNVGKNVLSQGDSSKYDEIVNEQEILLFCNRLVDDFEFGVHTEITSLEERKKVILIILESLKKAQDIDEFTDIVWEGLKKYKVFRVAHNVFANIEDRYDLLNNEGDFNKIVNIMSKGEFFDRWVVY